MKITEALRIINGARRDDPSFEVALACGFTPLHLATFLAAHLQSGLARRRVDIATGLYGDLAGALESVSGSPQAVAVALEWADLDPRLGYRRLGGWRPSDVPGILAGTQESLRRIERAIEKISADVPVVLSLPTLPLAPVFHMPGWTSSEAELCLQQSLAGFAACVGKAKGVSVIGGQRLAEESPPGSRFDLKSELLTGLPYTISHADALGAAFARLIGPRVPKKGLITDLDDTLWSGLAGEIGPDAVSWDLASHSQLHGLYQQLLRSLAGQGVLIGVASKNDPAVVEKVFEREDLLLTASDVFPLEAHWKAKSGSVGRILERWNIGAESVVFVDDSPLELAEVAAAHPDVECLLFPAGDYRAAYQFFHRLRDLFGSAAISAEDRLRTASIRESVNFREAGDAPESFLAGLNSEISFDFHLDSGDGRALELVNKTNQFNLNGIRRTETEWKNLLRAEGAFLGVASYRDKFGPLGRIAVIQGTRCEAGIEIGTWVMSCRAFARRIEHQCLRILFDRFEAQEIGFHFAPTAKNGPLRDFFSGLLGRQPDAPFSLSRALFDAKCPLLHHFYG